jgi:hypothetical protein
MIFCLKIVAKIFLLTQIFANFDRKLLSYDNKAKHTFHPKETKEVE